MNRKIVTKNTQGEELYPKTIAEQVVVDTQFGIETTQADKNKELDHNINEVAKSDLSVKQKPYSVDITLNKGGYGPTTATIPAQDGSTPNAGLMDSETYANVVEMYDETIPSLDTRITRNESAIDALQSRSDVVDVVGTIEELNDYDVSTITLNDVIKVLKDSTRDNAETYYRLTALLPKTWTFIGSLAETYTKTEADETFVKTARLAKTTGTSEDVPMTQKAVTDALNTIPTADGEDLTQVKDASGKDVLRFANRGTLNGMGYVILRKDKTFKEQVEGNINTIFEVRYNFDLVAANVVFGENCALYFNGGKVVNGSMEGNNTIISTISEDAVLFDGVTFSGTFANKRISVKWFNVIGEPLTDIKTQIPSKNEHEQLTRLATFISCCYSLKVDFPTACYGFGGGQENFTPNKNLMWKGYWSIDINSQTLVDLTFHFHRSKFVNLFKYYVGLWYLQDGVVKPCYDVTQNKPSNWTSDGGLIRTNGVNLNFTAYDVLVDMNRSIFIYGGEQSRSKGGATQSNNIFQITNTNNLILENVKLKKSVTDGILSKSEGIVRGYNVFTEKNGRCGWSCARGKDILLNGCVFSHNGEIEPMKDPLSNYELENPRANLSFEIDTAHHIDRIGIDNCQFVGVGNYHINTSRTDIVNISNSLFWSEFATTYSVVGCAERSYDVSNCTFVNTICTPTIRRDEKIAYRENMPIVHNCDFLSTKDVKITEGSEKNRGIFALRTETLVNYDDTTSAFIESDDYGYGGCVYRDINIYLHPNVSIIGSNLKNTFNIWENINIYLLGAREVETFTFFFTNIPKDEYRNIQVYEYTEDDSVAKQVEERYLKAFNDIKYKNLLGTKPSYRVAYNEISDIDRWARENGNIIPSVYANNLRLKDFGTREWIFGTSDSIKPEKIEDQSVIMMPYSYDLKLTAGQGQGVRPLFSLRRGNKGKITKYPYGFKDFYAMPNGVPFKFCDNEAELRKTIADNGYYAQEGDMVTILDTGIIAHMGADRKWVDPMGNRIEAKKEGPTSSRPTNLVKDGFPYFDTEKGKYVWRRNASSTGWIDANGAEI